MTQQVEQFVQLLTDHQVSVYVFILALVGNRTDADDVLSQTNLVLWRKFHQFQMGTDFGAWAKQIAWYEVKRHLREKRRSPLTLRDVFLDRVATAQLDRHDRPDFDLTTLDECLQKLSDKDRDLIARRYQPEVTTKSLASEVGRSVDAVYKAVARIRDALFECIRRKREAEQRE